MRAKIELVALTATLVLGFAAVVFAQDYYEQARTDHGVVAPIPTSDDQRDNAWDIPIHESAPNRHSTTDLMSQPNMYNHGVGVPQTESDSQHDRAWNVPVVRGAHGDMGSYVDHDDPYMYSHGVRLPEPVSDDQRDGAWNNDVLSPVPAYQ